MSGRDRDQRWTVTVDAHAVSPRWHIPAQQLELEAPDAYTARKRATHAALTAAGVPTTWEFVHNALQHVCATEAPR
jgi:hypothetical protein